MDWIQAQSKARGGAMVRRGAWPETQVVSDSNGTLSVTDARGFGAPYYPNAEDREASDWGEATREELAEAQEKARVEQAEKDKAAQEQAAKDSEAAGKASEDRAKAEQEHGTEADKRVAELEGDPAEVEGAEHRNKGKRK